MSVRTANKEVVFIGEERVIAVEYKSDGMLYLDFGSASVAIPAAAGPDLATAITTVVSKLIGHGDLCIN